MFLLLPIPFYIIHHSKTMSFRWSAAAAAAAAAAKHKEKGSKVADTEAWTFDTEGEDVTFHKLTLLSQTAIFNHFCLIFEVLEMETQMC